MAFIGGTAEVEDSCEDDKLREECGVFGILGHKDAAALTALGLHALQHRGQEACGIVTFDGNKFNSERRLGLVGDGFNKQSVIDCLQGELAVGHVRYSTTGSTVLRNVQPLFADMAFGGFALCHNGNLTNALRVRQRLVNEGALFQSTMDTEVILHLLARSDQDTVSDRFLDAVRQIEGGFSFVGMTNKKLIGARDPSELYFKAELVLFISFPDNLLETAGTQFHGSPING